MLQAAKNRKSGAFLVIKAMAHSAFGHGRAARRPSELLVGAKKESSCKRLEFRPQSLSITAASNRTLPSLFANTSKSLMIG
jgi:hypothetical protein